MSNSIQPTGSQNIQTSQTDTVTNVATGKFQGQVIANRNKWISKYLPILSGSFSLGQSLARICRSVGQSINAFFKQHFGGSSKATSTVPSSIEMQTIQPSRQYTLVDVPGDGHCGIYAVLVGMGKIKPSEFGTPTHSDQGCHPLAMEAHKEAMKWVRDTAARIAIDELKKKNGSYLQESLNITTRLQRESLMNEDFKYVARAVGRSIEVNTWSDKLGAFQRTLYQPNGEEVFLFPGDAEPPGVNPIRLYLAGGHYQLMQPDETPVK